MSSSAARSRATSGVTDRNAPSCSFTSARRAKLDSVSSVAVISPSRSFCGELPAREIAELGRAHDPVSAIFGTMNRPPACSGALARPPREGSMVPASPHGRRSREGSLRPRVARRRRRRCPRRRHAPRSGPAGHGAGDFSSSVRSSRASLATCSMSISTGMAGVYRRTRPVRMTRERPDTRSHRWQVEAPWSSVLRERAHETPTVVARSEVHPQHAEGSTPDLASTLRRSERVGPIPPVPTTNSRMPVPDGAPDASSRANRSY